jgi:hypothetical protein
MLRRRIETNVVKTDHLFRIPRKSTGFDNGDRAIRYDNCAARHSAVYGYGTRVALNQLRGIAK